MEKKAKNKRLSRTKNEMQYSFEKILEFQKPKIHKGISKAVKAVNTRPKPSNPKTTLKLIIGKSIAE